MSKETIGQYLTALGNKLQPREAVTKDFSDVKFFPLPKGKCIYILDFKSRTVTFQKGIAEMLGYEPEEFTFDLAVNFFHPEDYEIVTRLIKATLAFATENEVTRDVGLCLTYRIRKKDGGYLKVMRQSTVYEIDNTGKIISNLSMLTDISFLKTSNKVEWRFDAPGLDYEKFKRSVQQEYADFFSEREMEVIEQLKKGLKSHEIADKLHISKHTVDTHRRSVLKKSNSLNTIELLNFCQLHGIG